MPTSPPSTAPEMPRRLGPYRICTEIGSGGMSTVYLARVEYGSSIRRFVALKRMRPHLLEQPTLAEMFFDEANIASQVHHTNVCSVLDFDASPASQYLVMEYLMGESLSSLRDALERDRKRVAPGPRADLVARVIADAAEGLHATHEARDLGGKLLGVVHRDISPDNIFLTYDGTAKIVDFGVASAVGQKHETRTGVVKGKLAYLPPEVLTGHRPDRRADIWAMGVVLWEMLTLQRLFRRENDVDTFLAIKEGRVPPPSQVCPGLPDDFDALVQRALAINPLERFATARELGSSLQRVLIGRRSTVGTAEISQSMDALFPEGRARKRQLLKAAAELDDSEALRAEPSQAGGVSAPESSLRSGPAAAPIGPVTMPSAVSREPRTRGLSLRFSWPVGATRALSLTAAVGLLGTTWFSYRIWAGQDAAPAVAAAAPAPAPAPAGAPTLVADATSDSEAMCSAAATTLEAAPLGLERGTYLLAVTGEPGAPMQIVRVELGGRPAAASPEIGTLARLAVARPKPRPKQRAGSGDFWRHLKLGASAVKGRQAAAYALARPR